MKKPEFITFTGIDDRTDLEKASMLARVFPIEWGILFSPSNKDARYPSAQTIKEIEHIYGRKSVHLCGTASRDFANFKELPEEIESILNSIDRIQVNGAKGLTFTSYKHLEIILQCKEFGTGTVSQLFDISGGKGKVPDSIPSPQTTKMVGYAGGMGPETALNYLSKINCKNPIWIDMESRVRSNGWFDLNKVQKVCELVYCNPHKVMYEQSSKENNQRSAR